MTPQKIYAFIAVAIFLSLTPFLWLFTQSNLFGGPWPSFTNISGFIGGTILLWQIIIGNRSIFRKVIPNMPSMIKFHMAFGIYGTIFVLIHPLLIMLNYGQNLLFLLIPDFSTEFEKQISFGRISLLLFLVIWITSALIRKKLPYKLWLYIHYLSYLLVFFVFIHPLEIGTLINQFPFIKGYWLFLFTIYILVVIRRIYIFIKKPEPQVR